MYIDKSFFYLIAVIILLTGGAIYLIKNITKPPKKK